MKCLSLYLNGSFLSLQDLTMTNFQVSADKQFVLLAYNIQPVSRPSPNRSLHRRATDLFTINIVMHFALREPIGVINNPIQQSNTGLTKLLGGR